MLWKPYRLRKNWDFQKIIKKGKKFFLSGVFFYVLKNNIQNTTEKEENCLFGISIPKTQFKKAIIRNTIKREIKSLLIEYLKKNRNVFKETKESCLIKKKAHHHLKIVIIVKKIFLEKTKEEKKKIVDVFFSLITREINHEKISK